MKQIAFNRLVARSLYVLVARGGNNFDLPLLRELSTAAGIDGPGQPAEPEGPMCGPGTGFWMAQNRREGPRRSLTHDELRVAAGKKPKRKAKR